MGQKWTKEQHRRYRETIRRKKLERDSTLHGDASSDVVDAVPVDNRFLAGKPNTLTSLEQVHESLNRYWSNMTVAEKLDAIAKYLVS